MNPELRKQSPFKNVGDRVKFCDYFNKKTIYCPENPLLSNITFWAAQTEWITFKEIIPEIININLTLTDLVDLKIMKHIETMRKNLIHSLIGTEKQFEHKPFDLSYSIKEKMKKFIGEKHKTQSENAESNQNKTGESENV